MTPDVTQDTVPVAATAGSPPWDDAPHPGVWRAALLAYADAIDAELATDPAASAIKAVK